MQLKNGTTHVATVSNQGNHGSCLKVGFANKTWIHADSLGWLLPTNIRLPLEPFLKVLKEAWGDNLHTDIGTTVCVKLAHDHTGPPDNHCASHCLQNMPFQGDNLMWSRSNNFCHNFNWLFQCYTDRRDYVVVKYRYLQ